MIRKAGKDYSTQLKDYHSISLLTCMGKVVQKVVAKLLLEEAERRGLQTDQQFGSRNEQSGIKSAPIMVDRACAAWNICRITGMLLRDSTAAFPSWLKEMLVNLMMVRKIDWDLIPSTESFLTGRTLQMIIKDNAIKKQRVGAWVPQGSPASSIQFEIETSVLIKWIEEYISAAKELSLGDDLG